MVYVDISLSIETEKLRNYKELVESLYFRFIISLTFFYLTPQLI